MMRRSWTVGIAASLALSWQAAHAGVIPPVDALFPYVPLALNAGTISVSIYRPVGPPLLADGRIPVDDVTDTWLPNLVAVNPVSFKAVYIGFNQRNGGQDVPVVPYLVELVEDLEPGSPAFSASVFPLNAANPFTNAGLLVTSRYRGVCTNFGLNTDTSLDHLLETAATSLSVQTSTIGLAFGTTVSGFKLTPMDCGGMAVVRATVAGTVSPKIVIPRDSDSDGIPDLSEAPFCPAATPNCLDPAADIDAGPVAGAPTGDGIATFDERRGFIVSELLVRTNPTVKDGFGHLDNPQCLAAGADPLTSTASLLGLPDGAAGTVYPTDGTALFANVNTLIPGTQIHLLGHKPGKTNYRTNEWVDRFLRYTVADGFRYTTATGSETAIAPADDRQINLNAVFPLRDAVTNLTIQKGVRFVECVAVVAPFTLFGDAGLGTPNATQTGSTTLADKAVIFTGRMKDYLTTIADRNGDGHPDGLIPAGGSRTVKYSTFQNGAWTSPTAVPASGGDAAGTPTNADVQNFIVSKMIQYILGMEGGHSWNLTPAEIVARRTSYGHHWAVGTGSNLDQTIRNEVSGGAASGANTFYIPVIYIQTDQGQFLFHSTPP